MKSNASKSSSSYRMGYESSTSQEFLAAAAVAAGVRELEKHESARIKKDPLPVQQEQAATAGAGAVGGKRPEDDNDDGDEEQQQRQQQQQQQQLEQHEASNNTDSEWESMRSGNMNAQNAKAAQQAEAMIAREETKAVFRLKLLVITVLVLSMVGVFLAVYFYMSRAEHSEFESRYEDAANKVFESVGTTLHLSLGAVDATVVDFISFARYTNMTWPFVTIPSFAVRVAKIRSLSHAFLMQLNMLVLTEERAAWEYYVSQNDAWVQEGIEAQKLDTTYQARLVENGFPADYIIHNNTGPSGPVGPYAPQWQSSPVVPLSEPPYNWNGAEFGPIRAVWDEIFTSRRVVIAQVSNLYDPAIAERVKHTNAWIKSYLSPTDDETEPQSDIYYPMVTNADETVQSYDGAPGVDVNASRVVGFFTISVQWKEFIKGLLPTGTNGVVVVIGNVCNQSFTYEVNGPAVRYLGPGDRHETKFDSMGRSSFFLDLKAKYSTNNAYTGLPLTNNSCPFWIHVYPSQTVQDDFVSHKPIIFGICSACIFWFTSVVFLAYDLLVERRQRLVLRQAIQSSAIVSSLFPSVVRDRLFQNDHDPTRPNNNNSNGNFVGLETNKNKLKTFLRTDNEHSNSTGQGPGSRRPSTTAGATTPFTGSSSRGDNGPIADLFTDTTVMFADIAGFTAWSSVRQPSQVFTLLETLYGEFDRIATRRKVFKVETIGDSYVAVTGLPEPRDDHAVRMAKFAHDCRVAMARVTQELELTLGPDTGDLALRIGLNSGPVTAGVLRGQKSRFQLFGDTVNTCSRMESTSLRNCIQISQSTADLLIEAGKGHWVKPRKELVQAKGKGMMKTYWVEPRTHSSSVNDSTHCDDEEDADLEEDPLKPKLDDKTLRLVNWNVGMLKQLLQEIVARRNASAKSNSRNNNNHNSSNKHNKKGSAAVTTTATPTAAAAAFPLDQNEPGATVLDEVKEIIELPPFDPNACELQEDPSEIELSEAVLEQLRNFVIAIAVTYHDNPFHNFEHASHVTMSVVKLLSRIVAPDKALEEPKHDDDKQSPAAVIASALHDHTYGITSDPLTRFACVFAALVHDVDHSGVPNTVLVKENTYLSQHYKGKSVAEQNSVDIALRTFADDSYADLRAVVCPTEAEARRFRQLLVNSVMATDIMDKDLKALRNARWDKAFHPESTSGKSESSTSSQQEDVNRKATIVIEHLIQASDVAHTMQHWHIYRKWNERLFEEMFLAFKSGRTDKNPAEFWYQGEIGFFDFYIIPLAKKLSECGVFGVSSDEYLNYAQKNREEWVSRGEEVVANIVEKLLLLK